MIRLFPHKVRGEGHFVALLHKKAEAVVTDPVLHAADYGNHKKELHILEKDTDFFRFEQQLSRPFDRERLMVKQDMVYYLPEQFSDSWKLRYLRTGLLLGELKKGRFEPSQRLRWRCGGRSFQYGILFL